MFDQMKEVGLMISLGAGSFAVFMLVMRLFAPEDAPLSVSDIEAKRMKATSSFSSIKQDTMWGKLCLYILEAFKLEKPLEEQHLLLGSPATPQPVTILYQKILWAILLPILVLLVLKNFLFVIFIPLGFYIPTALVNSKIQKRQRDMLGNFSTTVDLAALIIESGLDYMTAFDRIIRIAKEKTVLEEELDKMLNEVKLGYSRREALERLANRTGVQEIRSFVGLIIQSDELGTSLVDLLRNFSIDLRFRRMNKAEKLAAQASTKMLVPLFLFIFPTVFILILAPMLKDIISSGGVGF
ncbi:TadC subunit [Elusimicrobium minutum Pei191]|uniref:TadC subunit n=1 Tax=Elusimicrobium minutum (strain Pei191) TaxID=445932 RepID=B2KE08_ELUMP|nr:type II secretion system F family protein [Elusimicrobium minutum]ACC98754.1 TadC subunit [Elusimicrobium minutum Pei191]